MALSEHRESLEHEEATLPASLQGSPSRDELDAALRALEVARGREAHLSEQVARLERRLLDVETDLAQARLESRRAEDFADELRATLSWRITAPLRTASRLLGRR